VIDLAAPGTKLADMSPDQQSNRALVLEVIKTWVTSGVLERTKARDEHRILKPSFRAGSAAL